MKKYLLLLILLSTLNGFAQLPPAAILPVTHIGASYATLNGAALLPAQIQGTAFLYFTDPNKTKSVTITHDYVADSLVSIYISGLQPATTYKVQYVVLTPYYDAEDPFIDSTTFTTLDSAIFPEEISSVSLNQQLSIVPDPIVDVSHLVFPEINNAEMKITDITGRLVKTILVAGGKGVIDKRDFETGIYFYRVSTKDKIYTGRFSVK